MKIKKLFPIVLSFLMAGSVFFGCSSTPQNPDNTGDTGTEEPESPGTGGETQTSTPLPAGKKIYVVGDSTVCSFSDDYYLPRYGYGTQLAEYLNVTSDQIDNLALSGRSSKSFLTEENYTTLTNSIAEGDYLIIGFGHNDEKSAEAARFTDPNGSKDVENTAKGTSLKWCLYEKYIKVAKGKGATPILCTPIVRYSTSADYSADKAHITADGNYPEAIKALGEETDTAVIDLTALTKAVYESDNTAAASYHAHTSYAGAIKAAPYDGTETPDGRDDTHINKFGAKMVAYQFANALKATDCSLKAHVRDEIAMPRKIIEYPAAINQSYVKPDYAPFDPANTTAVNLTGDWYATAMGELGGNSVTPFTISYADGTFTIGNNTSAEKKGKFNSTADGFAAAFIQIDASKNFRASATVKVDARAGADNQSAFGMMLRDDILINQRDTTLNTNYVAAGAFAVGGAIFSRENGTLKKEGNSTTLDATKTYTVSIERTGQTVVVTFADGTNTYTKTYTDFDFVARDNGNMYLCLFANRSIMAEFTNVQFEITGTSQGA